MKFQLQKLIKSSFENFYIFLEVSNFNLFRELTSKKEILIFLFRRGA